VGKVPRVTDDRHRAGPSQAGPDGTQPTGPRRGESNERIGPFSSWGRLYAVVLLYGVAMILLLLLLTRLLDPGTS
jgi:hypothetical protein